MADEERVLPRRPTLAETMAGAERATERVAQWPEWKRNIEPRTVTYTSALDAVVDPGLSAAHDDLPERISDAPPKTPLQHALLPILCELYETLSRKNAAYGNSALEPVRVFSRSDSLEQLRVRIDDKLSRVAKGHDLPTEDTIVDLIGYLLLYLVATKKETP